MAKATREVLVCDECGVEIGEGADQGMFLCAVCGGEWCRVHATKLFIDDGSAKFLCPHHVGVLEAWLRGGGVLA